MAVCELTGMVEINHLYRIPPQRTSHADSWPRQNTQTIPNRRQNQPKDPVCHV